MGDPEPITVLSLCSGGGGLDLGFKLAVPGAVTIGWVEWEAFACAELVRRMEAGELDAAPLWTDLRTFDGRPWRGSVDFLLAGYPCQPFSTAGRRGGEDDPRHLWPHVRRAVEEVQPWGVYFENVSGHFTLGLREVCEDLESLGYAVAVTGATAAEVGASHKRERVFILGVADRDRLQRRERDGEPGHQPTEGSPQCHRAVADPARGRERKRQRVRPAAGAGAEPRPEDAGGNVGDAGRGGRHDHGRPATVPEGHGPDHGLPEPAINHVVSPEWGGGERRGDGRDVLRPPGGTEGEGDQRERGRGAADGDGGPVGNAGGAERWPLNFSGRSAQPTGARRQEAADHPGVNGGVALADAESARPQGKRLAEPERRGEPEPLRGDGGAYPLFPPGPGDRAAWGRILAGHPALAPAATQPDLRGVADGLALDRSRYLRLLGNGVVPLQAAYAFVWLWMALEDAG